jgi:hypothetical protein
VEEAGGGLQQNQLSPSDWTKFAEAVRQLAAKREQKAGAFDIFVQRLQRRNYTIFMDAANIAFFNTLWLSDSERPNARFQWLQVEAVYREVKKAYPSQDVLVVVSGARCQDSCMHSDKERRFVNELKVCCLDSNWFSRTCG